jgi:multidrug efflux pump subunit AcrB
VLKMLPFDNKSEFQVVVDMPAGTPLEHTAAVLRELGAPAHACPKSPTTRPMPAPRRRSTSTAWCASTTCAAAARSATCRSTWSTSTSAARKSHAIATRVRPALQEIAQRHGANVKVVEVPPGPPVLSPIVAEIYGPQGRGRRAVAKAVRAVFAATAGVVDIDDSSIAEAPRKLLLVDRRKAAMLGVSQQEIVTTLRAGLAGEATAYLHDADQVPGGRDDAAAARLAGRPGRAAAARGAQRAGQAGADPRAGDGERHAARAADPPQGPAAGELRGRRHGRRGGQPAVRHVRDAPRGRRLPRPGGGTLAEYFIRQPDDALRGYTLKWDGEWQITYETFRDMGLAYAVGLVLIYLLVVAQFGSYLTPLIIMAPIPLTIIGVMPGHALLGAQFTATSMIGMIALAGIIVRNSILLVDFINLQCAAGVPFERRSCLGATRAQPILLTALAAMLGAFFILDDPIFNGLAISLIFGILVSTLLTLVVIPLLYYVAYRHRVHTLRSASPSRRLT